MIYEGAATGISWLSLTRTFHLDLSVKLMVAYSIFLRLISSAVSLIALSRHPPYLFFFVIPPPSRSSFTDSQLLISTAVCQTITEVNEQRSRAETFSPAVPRSPDAFIILT